MRITYRALTVLLALLLCLLPAQAFAEGELAPEIEYDSEHPEILYADQLYAQCAILVDASTGQVLFEKNADRQMSPASTTKIMTCLVALDVYADKLDEYVSIPAEAADTPDGSSVVPVKVGEEMTFRDLLYGMMLHSGNDAALAVAALAGGTVPKFVDLMNEKAQSLGLANTHFANPHGYTQEGHYTTARDMAALARAAMQNDTFRTIVRTMTYTMAATNARSALTLKNTNLWGASNGMYRYKYGNGIKTGFTNAAGQCLVGSATNDLGASLISVVFHSTVNNVEAKWYDSTKVMNYGFTRYQTYTFDQLYELAPVTVQLGNADQDDPLGGALTLKAMRNTSANFQTVLLDINVDAFLADFASRAEITYDETPAAPVAEGQILGTLSYTADDGSVVTALLTADRDVAEAKSQAVNVLRDFVNATPAWLLISIPALMILFLILWRISVAQKKRDARRRRIERARREAARARAQENIKKRMG